MGETKMIVEEKKARALLAARLACLPSLSARRLQSLFVHLYQPPISTKTLRMHADIFRDKKFIDYKDSKPKPAPENDMQEVSPKRALFLHDLLVQP